MSEKHSDEAVSEVIAFMLIFAMVVVFLAAWVIYYVPSEGHTAEVDHDEEVLRQFSDIKTGIDLLWTTTDNQNTPIERIVSLAPTKGTDLSTLLFLYPTLGSGTIKIETGTKFEFYAYNPVTPESPGTQQNVTTLRLSYTSFNEHSDDFSIVYDGGAVFYGEVGGQMSLLESPIISSKDNNILYVIAADKSLLNGKEELNKEEIIVGNNPVRLRITYTGKTNPITVFGSDFKNIESDYSDYWSEKVLNQDIIQVVILYYTIETVTS